MTQEEKAKAYDEALSQARFYYGNCPTEPEKKKLEKLFPELRESEDERIRKHCIWMLKGCLAMEDGLFNKEMVKADIAWLEKQKEQKPAVLSDDFELALEQFLMNADSSSNTFAEDVKKYANRLREIAKKEQKPAVEQLGGTFTSYDMAKTFTEGQKYVVAHPEKFGLCKPAEWSEEDEKVYNNALDAFYYKDCNDKDDVLFALKDLIDLVSEKRKVIPPYARWKPSDEQLRPLEYAIDYFKKKRNDTTYLESLYNDLKKLI